MIIPTVKNCPEMKESMESDEFNDFEISSNEMDLCLNIE